MATKTKKASSAAPQRARFRSRPRPANGTSTAPALRTGSVARWGNSLGVRIPAEGARKLGLKDGDNVKIEIHDDKIVVSRGRPRKTFSAADMLEGMTPEIAGPDLLPDRVGKEII